MPHLKASNKEDATIILGLDPSFTGVLRGVAHDESEGCTVKGNCIVKVNKTIKVRRFTVWLEGRCKVTLKSTGYSVSNTEGTESRTIYTKDQRFLSDNGQPHILTPGEYIYPFEFNIPPSLPASFRGKRGYVRYRLQAAIYRPMFASDIIVSRDVPIKRCLLNDETPMAELRETYEGRHHTNKLNYTAAAPSISYREGGLIRLNLTMQLIRPETQSVRTVTCALRERVQYRTTDGSVNTVLSKVENLFPLGYSTFYPNEAPDYDPKEKADYNALFRLCPRVNADMNSRLIKVTHALIVNIMVEDTSTADEDDESAYETDATESEWASEEDRGNHSGSESKHATDDSPTNTPPVSRPTSPILSRSSSASSIASIFSISRSLDSNTALDELNAESGNKSITSNTKGGRRNKNRRRQGSNEPRLVLCTLEVPLVVTSREHTWNEKPAPPPSYDAVEEPPSYHSTLEDLPRAPIYNGSSAENLTEEDSQQSTGHSDSPPSIRTINSSSSVETTTEVQALPLQSIGSTSETPAANVEERRNSQHEHQHHRLSFGGVSSVAYSATHAAARAFSGFSSKTGLTH